MKSTVEVLPLSLGNGDARVLLVYSKICQDVKDMMQSSPTTPCPFHVVTFPDLRTVKQRQWGVEHFSNTQDPTAPLRFTGNSVLRGPPALWIPSPYNFLEKQCIWTSVVLTFTSITFKNLNGFQVGTVCIIDKKFQNLFWGHNFLKVFFFYYELSW